MLAQKIDSQTKRVNVCRPVSAVEEEEERDFPMEGIGSGYHLRQNLLRSHSDSKDLHPAVRFLPENFKHVRKYRDHRKGNKKAINIILIVSLRLTN